MDTLADVQAAEDADHDAGRQRIADALAEAEALLAQPRDPEVVVRAAQWQRDHARRQAEERATEVARAERDAALRPTPKAAPAPAPKAVAYVPRSTFDRYVDGLEKALGLTLRSKTQETENKAAWRMAEAERRIAELEARLAKIEERGNG